MSWYLKDPEAPFPGSTSTIVILISIASIIFYVPGTLYTFRPYNNIC